ncbi:MAG: FAD/NAD(P)-binding protein, partial [Pseudomonadota bacterium]|nr:FAD/NAD(P)-binding protein [Pseudomonadota bacterium]
MAQTFPKATDAPSGVPTRSEDCGGECIAIIGGGPTGTYMLDALSRVDGVGTITVFESGPVPGPGLPFSEHLNDPHALANIAGVEIPPLVETLNDWARRQPPARLEAWGIAGKEGDERAFFPRIVLGAWLADAFTSIAAHSPVHTAVHVGCDVVDVVAMPGTCRVDWTTGDDRIYSAHFDRVIIATGYGATGSGADDARERTGRGCAGAEHGLSHLRLGILGSSLSAIDAIVSIAMANGTFARAETGPGLVYTPKRNWHATMMSRNGLLPEADFWFPVPLPPLLYLTEETVSRLVQGRDGDLDRMFALFAEELGVQDPGYAARIGLDSATADDFGVRYFRERLASDPWDYARRNLLEACEWHSQRNTPTWRIAILNAHDVFASIVPNLSQADLARFQSGLKRVFTDNYAAVPDLSISRLLALREAGAIDLIALGEDYRITPEGQREWKVRRDDWSARFDALVDARGQQPATLDSFP